MSGKFIKLREDFWVAPQISAQDVREAAALGVRLIVNNRPDGEMIGQPKSAELEAAAKAAGLSYAHIPVDGSGVSMAHIDALAGAREAAGDGPVLAFCRSGTRSTIVDAYAQARAGRSAEDIIADAARAGYDLTGHQPALLALYKDSRAPQD